MNRSSNILTLGSTAFLLAAQLITSSNLLADEKSLPVFEDGQAQIVPGFKDAKEWIRHDLWVETEFDSDGDGKKDRVHVAVTRPKQTETEGLKLPVIYETSPYFAGTAPDAPEYMWNTRHALGAKPPKHENPPAFERRGKRPIISNSQIRQWVPRGFIVVHSSSPEPGSRKDVRPLVVTTKR